MGIPKFKLNNKPKKDLKQLKLTDDQIESGEYPHEEIFSVKTSDGVLGYFWQYDLKDYVQQDTSFEEDTWIQKMGSPEWTQLFEHPFFQRRKPQIVNSVDAASDGQVYYVLEQGQKMGPFSIEEIREQVEHKKLLLTDMISVDEGTSWCKIYDLNEFDRRNDGQSFLPHSPEQELFSLSKPDIKLKTKSKSDATEQIAGLAYLGKNKAPIIEVDEKDEQEQLKTRKNLQWLWLTMILVSGIGIMFILLDSDEGQMTEVQNKQKQQQAVQRVKKAKAVKNVVRKPAVESTNVKRAAERNTDRMERRNRLRKSTPFKKSKTFKRAQRRRDNRRLEVRDDRYDEGNYYDDGTDPVELDPVRRTLSKDTIDPSFEEEERYDEYRDEEDLDRERENSDREEEYPEDY